MEYKTKMNCPRPQMIRQKWMSLNGLWDFAFDDENCGLTFEQYKDPSFFDQKIVVPYSYQTKKSLIERNEDHPIVWYRKEFEFDLENGKRAILHFDAVDYKADVFVNGRHMISHIGGHIPFEIDITDVIKERNEIIVRAEDFNLCTQPLGKQSWKSENFLCWYTRTTGIWQQVWIEEVGSTYISEVRMTPDIDNASLEMDFILDGSCKNVMVMAEISFYKKPITTIPMSAKSNRVRMSADVSSEDANFRLHFWSPADPNLYDVTFRVLKDGQVIDAIESYFGMRDISRKGNKVFLNNQELYQRLILDQGYIKDGGLTLTPEELENDLILIKKMGFNGARKHQKIEDARYMYLCDVLGLVMWAEMPSFFEFSHKSIENVNHELHGLIAKHYNHPSVIVYTLMNESWGINEVYKDKRQQAFINSLYWMTKALDSTRLIVGNDGWEQTTTDILTVHDYNSDPETLAKSYENMAEAADGCPSLTSLRHTYAKDYQYAGEPFMISEFGGVAFDTGSMKTKSSWGYGDRLNGKEAVLEKIGALTQALINMDGMCGYCYTQLSDVEQEVNGLLDHNHNPKFDPEVLREIFAGGSKRGFLFI